MEPSGFKIGINGLFEVGKGDNIVSFSGELSYIKSAADNQEIGLALRATNRAGVGVGDVIRAVTGKDPGKLPELVDGFKVKNVAVKYGSGISSQTFELLFKCQVNFGATDLELDVIYKTGTTTDKAGKGAYSGLSGVLKLGEHQFGVKFMRTEQDGSATTWLICQYLNEGKTTLQLKKIAGSLFPGEFKDNLPDVSLTLDKFRAFILYGNESLTGSHKVVFCMGASAEMGGVLKDLPMVGPMIASNGSFGVKDLLLMVGNGKITSKDTQTLGDAIKDLGAGANFSDSFHLSATIAVGNETYSFNSSGAPMGAAEGLKQLPEKSEQNNPVDQPQKSISSSGGGEVAVKNNTPLPANAKEDAKWVDVNKKLGPIELQRLGYIYKDGRIVLLFDASFKLSVLSVQLLGLGLGFKVGWPPQLPPDFSFEGIGISFKAGPVALAGMFARIKRDDGYEFYGAAMLKISKISIAGVGAFARVKKKGTEEYETSFFVFAVFKGTIGGPAFFFVTGIAAGFGFNRSIRMPAIEAVRDFPFVQAAMGEEKGINEVLTDLIRLDAIPISAGDYWVALGVKFSSFKLIESFALLIVQFGTRLQFSLLGLSVLEWPPKELRTAGTDAIAVIELAILAHFAPDSDVITVRAMITDKSYIFSKNCKLAGGFAFYCWVKGPHAGDFVVTLGGYHSKFNKPAHYPNVDRLSLTWQITDEVLMKGEMYFALTSSAIMAGGKWELSYQSSSIKASLKIWADMIMSWAPFFYELNVGIQIYVEARVNIGFINRTYTTDLQAALEIWGPEFSGKAYVKWTVISFTIEFGSKGKKKPDPLKWGEFRKMIPQPEGKKGEDFNPIDLKITSGIIKEYKSAKGDKLFLVNPSELQAVAECLMPITTLRVLEKDNREGEIGTDCAMITEGSEQLKAYRNRNLSVGMLPMGVKTFTNSMTAGILQKEGSKWVPVQMNYALIGKSVVHALWGNKPLEGEDAQSPKMIKDVLSGIGFSASGRAKDSETRAVIVPSLSYKRVKLSKTFDLPKKEGYQFNYKERVIDAGIGKYIADDLMAQGFEGLFNDDAMSVINSRPEGQLKIACCEMAF